MFLPPILHPQHESLGYRGNDRHYLVFTSSAPVTGSHADLPGLRHTQSLGTMRAWALRVNHRDCEPSAARGKHELGVSFPPLLLFHFLLSEGEGGLERSHPCEEMSSLSHFHVQKETENHGFTG